MFKWLHGHFLPSEGNNHQPHFLRSDSVQVLLAFLLISQVFFLVFTIFVVPNSKQVAAIIASTLVTQTNNERIKKDAQTLTTNVILIQSAQMKANDMAEKGYFSHKTPDGKDPWFWFKKAKYDYQYAGENLAVNFVESDDVTSAWMNSPTHRDNLLNSKFTEVGIATAIGKYKGRDAIFVVQHFGKPLRSTVLTNQNVNTNVVPTTATKETNSLVLGTSTEASFSLWSRFLTLIGNVTISLQLAIAFLTTLALMLAILIKVKIQHPVLLANGIILISITILFVFINTIIIQGTI